MLDVQYLYYMTGYARIVLAILSFYFMPTDYIMAANMYLLSGLLDAFDGHAARYFSQSKFIDYNVLLTFDLPIYCSTSKSVIKT